MKLTTSIKSFYRISKPSKTKVDPALQEKKFRMLGFQTFLAGTIGYSLYYVCRTSLNVVKKPILDSGMLDASQLGVIGSVLLFAYAIGKFVNGFLADHCNIKRFMATGLLVYLAGVLIDKSEAAGASSHDAALHAWTVIMAAAAVLLVILGIYHRFSLPAGLRRDDSVRKSAGDELKAVIGDFFTKKHIWLYIAFIILYRLGEGFVMKIVPLFLKADVAAGGLGLSEQQIGLYYGTFGAGAFVLGSLLAGYYISHFGLKKTLFSLVCIFNLPFLVYAWFAWVQPSSALLIGSGIVLEYFGYGFGFVGLTLFMMQQVASGKHEMAHYAFASAIMNLSVMVTGAVSGFLSDALGYKLFFIVVMLATVPIFILSRVVPFRDE